MFINGKEIAQKILDRVRADVAKLPFRPVFCDVVVGNDPVSLSFVQLKGKTAESAGFLFALKQFPESISQVELVDEITRLNREPHMCGLIVQLPLPPHLDRDAVLNAIHPALDVDCLTRENQEKFYRRIPGMVPPTAAAIMEILQPHLGDPAIVRYAVIGRGMLVGKPVAFLLDDGKRIVSTADNNTPDIAEITAGADVIISATGQAGLITGAMVKPGAIVIDAGTSEMDGGIVGDVEKASVAEKAAWLAGVPGGVGPVTIAKLLANVAQAAKNGV